MRRMLGYRMKTVIMNTMHTIEADLPPRLQIKELKVRLSCFRDSAVATGHAHLPLPATRPGPTGMASPPRPRHTYVGSVNSPCLDAFLEGFSFQIQPAVPQAVRHTPRDHASTRDLRGVPGSYAAPGVSTQSNTATQVLVDMLHTGHTPVTLAGRPNDMT